MQAVLTHAISDKTLIASVNSVKNSCDELTV